MPFSNHTRDKLLAELQSGTMTSGAASISVGPVPAGYVKFDNWPTSPTPVYGLLTDPATGQSWRIRLNQDAKQWEIVDDPIPTPTDLLSTPEIRERFEQTSAALRRAHRERRSKNGG